MPTPSVGSSHSRLGVIVGDTVASVGTLLTSKQRSNPTLTVWAAISGPTGATFATFSSELSKAVPPKLSTAVTCTSVTP